MSIIVESASMLRSVTPMMKQYLEIKDNYRGYILMYRLGDFYEMFFEDATLASRVLELTLTGRDCGDNQRAPMCGIPFHSADKYISKLVDEGYKIAICEQTEDPATAKGIVRRDVIRVITPGTITDGSMLSDKKNNYLAALFISDSIIGVGFADISTGQISVTRIEGPDKWTKLESELGTYRPSEIISNVKKSDFHATASFVTDRMRTVISDSRPELFDELSSRMVINEVLGNREEDLDDPALLCSVGALLSYIKETQKCDVSFVRELNIYSDAQYVELDLSTRRNLELTEAMRTKEKRGSLLWVLDKTETSMGARTLRSWINRPLLSVSAISARQDAVADLAGELMLREEIRDLLSKVLDLERLTAKAVYGTANAKDLYAIAQSLSVLPEFKSLLSAFSCEELKSITKDLDLCEDICSHILRAICDDPPFSLRDGGIIRDGYDRDVDHLRSVMSNGKGWIEEIELKERELTGIKNLRIGYNRVFGYYIEVTKSQIELVPDRYIRKQTLANGERYITQELKDMEATVLGASDKLTALEYSLFIKIREAVAEAKDRILKSAAYLAKVDVYTSLADVAVKNNYTRPEVDLSDTIEIRDGRHPVVEKFVSDSYFVPNDTFLDTASNRLMLITGPNMAGKSTYMRQVAIICIMAQIGSFVPAKEARIGIVDKIFTRVGASDDLASGQSTFMLEMNEVAHILSHATRRSLIVYDEVGRGTSTYDGMSIARAVAEYTAGKRIGAKTLFATHYHELTVLEGEIGGVVNYNIAAKKRGDSITFLRKIVRGATDDSYGIEVAKLAGVPSEVIRRAKDILADIEASVSRPQTRAEKKESDALPDIFEQIERSTETEVADKLRATDINTLTPIEAMNLIFEMKKTLGEK